MNQPSVAELVIVPDKIFCEMHDERDACDVTVQMEDGAMYTALFATVPFIKRQMALTYLATASIPQTPPVRYAALDTPHIIVDALDMGIIEDTVDNLFAQDVFESLFTRVTHDADADRKRTTGPPERTTQEIATAVIQEALQIVGE